MKIMELHLSRFGPFEDRLIDLSEPGVQMIYGPNEAGKSTTLRSIINLLYGFPKQTPDDHRFDQKTLLVGAKVEGTNHQYRYYFRRKGNKNTLIDEEQKPIAESELKALCNHLSKEQFTTFFGLSYHSMVAGAEALLKGEGSLGEAIFQASLGGARLRQIQHQMKAMKESLYKKSGVAKKPKLNQTIAQYKEIQKQQKEQILKPAQWSKTKKTLDQAVAEHQDARTAYIEANKELERLERVNRTQPSLAKRELLIKRLQEFEQLPILPERATEKRIQASQTLSDVSSELEPLEKEIKALQTQLEDYEPPDLLLSRDGVIEKLERDRALYEEHSIRQHKLDAEIKQSQQQYQGVQQQLGLLEEDDPTPPSEAVQQEIFRQIDAYNKDQHTLNNAREQCSVEEKRVEQLKQLMEALPQPEKGESLKHLVDACIQLGDIEAEIGRLRQQQQSTAVSIEEKKSKLSLQQLTLEELSNLNIPNSQSINTYIEQFTTYTHSLEQIHSDQEQLTTQIDDIEELLRKEHLEAGLITEQDLMETRESRNQIWSKVKQDWFEVKTTANEDQRQDAEKLDRLILKSDEQSDRLRREAERAARHAQLTAGKEAIQKKLHTLEAKKENTLNQIKTLLSKWEDEWPTKVKLLDPKAMRVWAEQCLALQSEITHQRLCESEQSELQQQCDQHKQLLKQELDKFDTNLSFKLLLAEAKDRLQQIQADNEQYQRQNTLLENSVSDLKRHQDGLSTAEQHRLEWKVHWKVLMTDLSLTADATPDMAATQLELFKKWNQHYQEEQKLKLELDTVEQSIEQFTTLAHTTYQELHPEGESKGPLIDLSTLQQQLKQAQIKDKEVQQLRSQLANQQDQQQVLIRKFEQANLQLQQLFKAGNCDNVETLITLEKQNAERKQLELELDSILQVLTGESLPLEQLIDEAEHCNIDELPILLTEAKKSTETCSKNTEDAVAHKTEIEQQFKAMNGNQDAAELAQQAANALSTIDEHYREYCKVAIAERLIKEQIDQYREEHQGPVIRKATEYFKRMTLENYQSFSIDYDEEQPKLYCVRGEEHVPISGLSEGTRDQLYLALQLASIDLYLDHHEPIPMVIDDILVNFDDQRSVATLELLGEISQRTQVLYFTHHEHLVTLLKGTDFLFEYHKLCDVV